MVSSPPLRHGVPGVDAEVHQRLVQALLHAGDHQAGPRHLALHPDVGRQGALQHGAEPVHQVGHVHGCLRARAGAGEAEQPPREPAGPVGNLGQGRHSLLQVQRREVPHGQELSPVHGLLQHPHVVLVNGEQVAQVMGHLPGQPPQGLQLLHLEDLLLQHVVVGEDEQHGAAQQDPGAEAQRGAPLHRDPVHGGAVGAAQILDGPPRLPLEVDAGVLAGDQRRGEQELRLLGAAQDAVVVHRIHLPCVVAGEGHQPRPARHHLHGRGVVSFPDSSLLFHQQLHGPPPDFVQNS